MIARLFIRLPFGILVEDGASFQLRSYEEEDCVVSVRPPGRSNLPSSPQDAQDLTIDGRPAFLADALTIDFRRDSFDRRQGEPRDPPDSVIKAALESFIRRLRYVTQAHQVLDVPFPNSSWRIVYLQDDETELEQEEGLVKAWGAREIRLSLAALTPSIFDDAHELSPDWTPPAWSDLIIQATGALPKVGPAIVLAATALEVFIAETLDHVADHKNFPPDLWEWINDRSNWLKDPSVVEQFDPLLKHLVGHSLQEDQELWTAFQHLRKARNSFVHEGVAKVGENPLSPAQAASLVNDARRIIGWTRQWLPDELRWPEFSHKVSVSAVFQLRQQPAED